MRLICVFISLNLAITKNKIEKVKTNREAYKI